MFLTSQYLPDHVRLDHIQFYHDRFYLFLTDQNLLHHNLTDHIQFNHVRFYHVQFYLFLTDQNLTDQNPFYQDRFDLFLTEQNLTDQNICAMPRVMCFYSIRLTMSCKCSPSKSHKTFRFVAVFCSMGSIFFLTPEFSQCPDSSSGTM